MRAIRDFCFSVSFILWSPNLSFVFTLWLWSLLSGLCLYFLAFVFTFWLLYLLCGFCIYFVAFVFTLWLLYLLCGFCIYFLAFVFTFWLLSLPSGFCIFVLERKGKPPSISILVRWLYTSIRFLLGLNIFSSGRQYTENEQWLWLKVRHYPLHIS